MPTLAQALQDRPVPGTAPRIVGVLGATGSTITTDFGDIVNGTSGIPVAGQRVLVLTVEGAQIAVAWFS